MTYATRQEIVDLYGSDLLVRVADHDKDGVPEDSVITLALEGADEVINAYLSLRYTTPLPATPGVVRACAIDIAVYRMAMGRAGRTEEMRVRYEDALAILDKIAKGTVGLGLPPTDTNGDGIPDPVAARGRGRIFDIGRG